jgi:long-subunit acyl-CoA synthetase (AMP-forming)
VNHPFKSAKESIGKALPQREIMLDPNGEILVRGDAVAAGCCQDGRLQPVLGSEGWFHTGELLESRRRPQVESLGQGI